MCNEITVGLIVFCDAYPCSVSTIAPRTSPSGILPRMAFTADFEIGASVGMQIKIHAVIAAA